MSRLARPLRAEGFIGPTAIPGSLIWAPARAGVFWLGGTIVEMAAYALYQGELDLRFDAEQKAPTGNIDFASFEELSVTLGDRVEENPREPLRPLKFEPVPGGNDRPVWRWRQRRGEAMV